jgi:two-component system OmpR family response regulator
MKIAIAGTDPALADLCAFAARRRGHDVVCLDSHARLFGPLPFSPSTAILGMSEFDDTARETIQALGHTFPNMQIVVTVEQCDSELEPLKAGASDVVRVPYNPYALIERAELGAARVRRTADTESIVRVEDLEVDLGRYAARKNGASMTMTKLELRLLFCLCDHFPHLAATERLLTFGWEGSLEADPALIKTHISHIRSKMRAAGGVPLQIRSRQTLGYELAVE